MSEYCIDTKDHNGIRVILIEAHRQRKMIKHPELREPSFLLRIKAVIENPGFIYEDFAEKDRLVYYKYEYSVNGRAKYIKVVVQVRNTPFTIVTAFRPDRVKERGKSKLIYGKDEE